MMNVSFTEPISNVFRLESVGGIEDLHEAVQEKGILYYASSDVYGGNWGR